MEKDEECPMMPKPVSAEDKKARLAELNPKALFADGFEDALVAFGAVFTNDPIAIYDRAKCIEILKTRDGMTHEEAEEFFELNVSGAYVGKNTPAFIQYFEDAL
jgi:hypothetical protein